MWTTGSSSSVTGRKRIDRQRHRNLTLKNADGIFTTSNEEKLHLLFETDFPTLQLLSEAGILWIALGRLGASPLAKAVGLVHSEHCARSTPSVIYVACLKSRSFTDTAVYQRTEIHKTLQSKEVAISAFIDAGGICTISRWIPSKIQKSNTHNCRLHNNGCALPSFGVDNLLQRLGGRRIHCRGYTDDIVIIHTNIQKLSVT